MSIPDYQTVMLPLLRLASNAETRVPDIADRVANEFGLSTVERDQLLPSGRQRILHNRVHWAKFYMTKAGLINSTRRGWFIASDKGRELLDTKPERIDVDYLLSIPVFEKFYKGSEQAASVGEKSNAVIPIEAKITPEENLESAYQTLQSTLREELLARILQNSASFFEGVIVDLLVAMGYGGSRKDAATQLGRSGDGGVDGVINEDALGLDRIYVQAKRYAPGISVGRPDVQGFVGSLVGLGATKGVFVTTSSFSQPAVDFVRHLSQRVILMDGKRLADLMVEHNVGVRISRTMEFKRLDEDFFSDEG